MQEPLGNASGRHVLSRFVKDIPMPGALLDERGRFIFINDAWKAASRPGGLMSPNDDVGGQHIEDLRAGKGLNSDSGKRLAEAIEAALKGGTPGKVSYKAGKAEKGNPEEEEWEATVSRIPTPDGPVALVLHRDRSALQKAKVMGDRVHRLSVDQERNEAVDAERIHLIHAAEQALQGPLTPIRIGLHLLMGEGSQKLSPEHRKAVERIARNVDRLRNMQADLFGQLRDLEGRDEPAAEIDLVMSVRDLVAPLQEEALQQGVKLLFQHSSEGLKVRCPPKAMSGVLLTLIHHAIQATPAGGTVSVQLAKQGDNVEFVLEDEDPEIGEREAAEALDTDAEEPVRAGLRHAAQFAARWGGDVSTQIHGERGLRVHIVWPMLASSATGEATQHV